MVMQYSSGPYSDKLTPTTVSKPTVALGDKLYLAIGLTAVLALAAAILCYELTEPFLGHHDWNSAWMSSAARNHLRYGYMTTRLAVIENNDIVPTEWFRYYTRHPPLVPLFVSFSFRLFGVNEWAARSVPIAFSLASVVLVYLLGTGLGGCGLGLLAAFIYALLPMSAYFGRMVNHEAVTNFFVLTTVLTYFRWHQTRCIGPFILALVTLAVGALCDWPGYYLAGILPLHHLLVVDARHREWKILLFPLTALAAFDLYLGHLVWVQGVEGALSLAYMFFYRTNLYLFLDFQPLSLGLESLRVMPDDFTWAKFLSVEVSRAAALFTPLVLILAVLSFYDIGRRRGGRRLSDPLLLVMLLLFGISHVIFFSQGAWQHDYWLFYCSPALALLAANGGLSLTEPERQWRVLGLLAVLLVLSAQPRIQQLHNKGNLHLPRLALLVQENTPPGALVLTNVPDIYGHAPALGYYAGRDVSYNPILQISEFKRAIAANKRPIVFAFSEEGEGGVELGLGSGRIIQVKASISAAHDTTSFRSLTSVPPL